MAQISPPDGSAVLRCAGLWAKGILHWGIAFLFFVKSFILDFFGLLVGFLLLFCLGVFCLI